MAGDVLKTITDHKLIEVAAAKQRVPEAELLRQLATAPAVRDFAHALRHPPAFPAGRLPIAVIAEIKKASPSAGLIRSDFDPVAIAKIYAAHGASCLSVLTDERFFQGALPYLTEVRSAVDLPVLRKDFIIDRYQVLEARAAGADAILLIAECLSDCQMRDLYFYASELGMSSLIEVYDPDNMDRVLKLEPELVGVNNRNLRTMITDLNHSLTLRQQVPDACLFVSESGIGTVDQVRELLEHRVSAMLVGETLMRSPDIGVKLDQLLGVTKT